MLSLITLELHAPDDSLEYASSLPVLKDLQIDTVYGLVPISPKRHLYVLRLEGELDRDKLLSVPQVKGVHGDVRVSAIEPE